MQSRYGPYLKEELCPLLQSLQPGRENRDREKNCDMVRKSFIQCGISIRPDGSQDQHIKIKDIPSNKIDFSGWGLEIGEVEKAYERYIGEEQQPDLELPHFNDVDEFITAREDMPISSLVSHLYGPGTGWTNAKLIAELKARGAKGYSAFKKSDLIDMLEILDAKKLREQRRQEKCIPLTPLSSNIPDRISVSSLLN